MHLTAEAFPPPTDCSLPKKNRSYEIMWMLSLYGTAIGAGTLFLPINAGLHGIWPLLVMLLLAFPMTYLPHRALCRFVQSGTSSKNDFADVVAEHFGPFAGVVLTLIYFLSIYPVLLMYGVALTNTIHSFMLEQLHLTPPPRLLLSFAIVFGLMAIVRLGQDTILKAINMMVYPFIGTLIFLSLYLIPFWNTAMFESQTTVVSMSSSVHELLKTIWLLIPVMIFSFSHSPIISTFAISQRARFGLDSDKQSARILKYSHLMMVATVMFFVLSCVASLSPHDLMLAKEQNVNILSYLANRLNTPVMGFVAPLVAFIAISKSFLGHYLGAKEGMYGLISRFMTSQKKNLKPSFMNLFIELFILLTCWMIATLNPNVLGMIERLVGPTIAFILFMMPMYAIAKIPSLKKYHHGFHFVFVMGLGLIAISALVYGIFEAIVG